MFNYSREVDVFFAAKIIDAAVIGAKHNICNTSRKPFFSVFSHQRIRINSA
jgi:hypothetical protein